ncbi:MAG: hypothetical protein KGS61_12130 [Verrucomicrobia bacterium]|nr:hypothetical protein [Verrucomicrobiota bacterium]
MTDLDEPVRPRTREAFGHYRRRMIVSLEIGDTLAMRLERSRTVYRASLAAVFRQLADWRAEAEHRTKRAARRRQRTA